MSYSVIGVKTTNDKLGEAKATGKLDYSTDHVFEGMLYASVLTSPYPHAKITSIDSSAVLALPGVKAVTTYQNNPVMTQELFYVGQEVAAVAATDPHIAEQAVELFKVTYQQLTYVLDPKAAMQSGAPLVGVNPGSNIVGEAIVFTMGDVDTAFARSDVISVEDTIGPSAAYQHSTLQPRACIAMWDALGTHLTVYTNSQNPHAYKSGLAADLKIPMQDVSVIDHGTGGGFGDLNYNDYGDIAAVLAKMTGVPVMYQESRRVNYLTATHQYPDWGDIKLGATADGTFVAVQATFYTDVGAYPWPAVGDAISPLQITYNIPNMSITANTVVTNKPRCAYWRCVGEPGGLFDLEPVIDQLAYKLGVDPVAIRAKNCKKSTDTDNATGLPFSSLDLVDCFNQAATTAGWSTKWHQPKAKVLPDGRYHGIGVAGFVCNKGAEDGVSAVSITTTTDGGFIVHLGHSGIQSTPTAMALVAAEELGANAGDVTPDYGETDHTQDCGMQAGSSCCHRTGLAVIQAADDVKNQVFPIAATMLNTQYKINVTASDLSAKGGSISVTANPSQSVTYAAVLSSGIQGIIGKGYSPYDATHVCRTASATVAEVAVDISTGAVEVTNMVTADDLGQALHWLGAEGQIQGGIVQSLGFALMWTNSYVDPNNGVTMNPDYLGCKFPGFKDVPIGSITPIIVEPHDMFGPFGAKGLGEPAHGSSGPAICTAIYNAIGVWVKQQPATPDQVLAALGAVL